MRTNARQRLSRPPSFRAHLRGFTLIELIIVTVVAAILGAIAIGSYRRYVLRANRTDATTALLRIQVAEEKFFLQNNTYTTEVAAATGLNLGSTTTPNGYYSLSVGPGTGTGGIATSFVATATVRGTQTQDSTCTSLTLDDQGIKGASPGAVTTCWR